MSVPVDYHVRARNLAVESENKIHDDDVAAQFGFTGGLVPGVELFAYAAHPFVAAWGVDFLRQGRLQLRFRRPVYDGDEVVVSAEPGPEGFGVRLMVDGDEEARAAGAAQERAAGGERRQRYEQAALPEKLAPIWDDLPTGPLGSVSRPVERAAHDDYLDGIGETLPIFRANAVVHPGAVLRMVNDVLMQNIDLGPWIHTSSDCRFLGVATAPTTLECHGVVVECFERNGNAYVRYDALVTADSEPVAEVDHTAIYRLADRV